MSLSSIASSVASGIAPATFAALALLIGAGAAAITARAANTYRWVDAQGVVHYSDTPQPGAEVVPLPSAQTYRAPAAPPVPPTDTVPAPPAAYQSCAITQPAADTELFAPETVSVSVQVVPNLRPGDQLSVSVDGAALPAVSGTQGPVNFQLPQPERGQHTISAEVHDAQGQTVCSAAAVSFSVQRPSLLSPQSPAKGH
jgi:hypothetical protein